MTDPIVEIARSFSYRLPLAKFEHADFFCSQKTSCNASEAASVSDKLYAFCKAQVLKEVREFQAGTDEVAEPVAAEPETKQVPPPAPETDKYAVQELPAPAAQEPVRGKYAGKVDTKDTPTTREPEKETPAQYCARLSQEIYSLSNSTIAHRNDYLMGWFGAATTKNLPRKPDAYIDPLTALLEWLKGDIGRANLYRDGARALGEKAARARKELVEEVVAKQEKKLPTLPPFEQAGQLGLTDADVFPEDPVMKRFNWKDMQTAAVARAWMTAYDKDLDSLEKHLLMLKMASLEEHDLQAILLMWYHDPANTHTMWKKCESLGITPVRALELVSAQLTETVSLNSSSKDVIVAMVGVISALG